MEIELTAKGIELNQHAQKQIESKVKRITRHMRGVVNVQLELEEQKTKSPEHQFSASAFIEAESAMVRGRARGDNLLTAIDKLADVLDRQLEKTKGRKRDKERALPEGLTGGERALSDNYAVKVRQMPVKEMSVESAIDKMESLDYDFYLFLAKGTKSPRVLYRKADGDYGLVEPSYKK